MVDKYIEVHEADFDNFFENNNEYIINDDLKLVLSEFSINYDEELDRINSLSIYGYLLEK